MRPSRLLAVAPLLAGAVSGLSRRRRSSPGGFGGRSLASRAVRPWAPFVNAGAGVSATDIQGPDLSKVFQFNLQAGGGVHYYFGEKTALALEYRWLHFSNAGIIEVNFGTNTQMFLIGVNWFY